MMKGYVVKKGNCYYVVVYEGFDEIIGWDCYCWYVVGEICKIVEKMLIELIKRVYDGDYWVFDWIIVVDYFVECWLLMKKV